MKISGYTFFEKNSKCLPELLVLFTVLFCLLCQKFKKTFGDDLAQLQDQGIILQGLTGDVQGQVLRVNYTLHKTKPLRQDIFTVLINEYLLAVEIDAGLHAAHTHGLKVFFGRKEQGVDGQWCIGCKVEPVGGLVNGIADKLVKFSVLLIRDFTFGAGPDGLYRINLVALDLDRKGNKGGVLFDDALNGKFLTVFVGIVFEIKDYSGAPVQSIAGTDGIGAAAVGLPLVAFAAVPGTGLDRDLVSCHKGGVKADPELADKVDVFLGRFSKFFQKVAGTGMGNGAQVGFQLSCTHADTGVGDGQSVLFVITVNGNFKGHMGIKFRFLCEREMAKFLQRICCVGNQFSDKNVSFGVE